jgi:hypothetical protein
MIRNVVKMTVAPAPYAVVFTGPMGATACKYRWIYVQESVYMIA